MRTKSQATVGSSDRFFWVSDLPLKKDVIVFFKVDAGVLASLIEALEEHEKNNHSFLSLQLFNTESVLNRI